MKKFILLPVLSLCLASGGKLLAQSNSADNNPVTVKTGTAAMAVGSGTIITVSGAMTVDPGGKITVNTGGAMTVESSLTNNASPTSLIIESGGSLITEGSVSGYATIKREIAGNLGWHLVSSPVSYQLICNGTFAPLPGNFSTTPSNTYDFYKYQPLSGAACGSNLWLNLRNTDLTPNTTDFGTPPSFNPKSGYLVAYNGDFPSTKIFTGTPNTGDQTFPLIDLASFCPWNLLGNPYPSAVDWDQVTGKSNLVNGYYYIYNENKSGGPGYESYLDATHKTPGANGKIPPMQGFFVKASGASLSIPNSARTHQADNFLKSTNNVADGITLRISNDSNFDESYILFETKSKTGTDWFDASKMLSLSKEMPQIYTIAGNDQKAQINSMPPVSDPVTIPVGIVAPVDGQYSIRVSGMENVVSLTGLSLEDMKMKYTQDLLQNPVYTFTASGNEDAGRFLLLFNGASGSTNDNSPIRIYSSGKTINIFCASGLQQGQVTVSNMLGQLILAQQLTDQSLNQVQADVLNGYYIVKVQSVNTVKTAKVYIQ